MKKEKKEDYIKKWKPFMKRHERFEEMSPERKEKFLRDIAEYDIKDFEKGRPE